MGRHDSHLGTRGGTRGDRLEAHGCRRRWFDLVRVRVRVRVTVTVRVWVRVSSTCQSASNMRRFTLGVS